MLLFMKHQDVVVWLLWNSMGHMGKIKSWEVSDRFLAKVEPLIPIFKCDPNKFNKLKAGDGRKSLPAYQVFEGNNIFS